LTKYLSTSFSFNSSSACRCARSSGLSRAAHAVRDGVVEIVEQRALLEVEAAERVQRLALAQEMLGLVVELERGALSSASSTSRRWRITGASGSAAPGCRLGRALDLAHVRDQHGVVRGHRAPALGQHVRRPSPCSAQASASGVTMVCAYWSRP
jgi:hypothetical protein